LSEETDKLRHRVQGLMPDLDIKKFNQLKETKWVIAKLRKHGVDGDWLRDNGYVVAAVILDI